MCNKVKIVEVYYRIFFIIDFNGLYKGCYIDFDVKEINFKISFLLFNVYEY